MFELITALIAAQLQLAAANAEIAALEATPPIVEYVEVEVPVYYETVRTEYVEVPTIEYVETGVNYFECGVCGAHVNEWWYVRNDADTDFVEVCEHCYVGVLEELAEKEKGEEHDAVHLDA